MSTVSELSRTELVGTYITFLRMECGCEPLVARALAETVYDLFLLPGIKPVFQELLNQTAVIPGSPLLGYVKVEDIVRSNLASDAPLPKAVALQFYRGVAGVARSERATEAWRAFRALVTHLLAE